MTARSRYVIDGFMDMYLGPGSAHLYEGENAYRNRLCVLDVKVSINRICSIYSRIRPKRADT